MEKKEEKKLYILYLFLFFCAFLFEWKFDFCNYFFVLRNFSSPHFFDEDEEEEEAAGGGRGCVAAVPPF